MKLKTEEKVTIGSHCEESLRATAENYGVHHSIIDDIRKESADVLTQYWTQKRERVGRPVQARPNETEEAHKAELEQLQYKLALKEMRVDYLELKLKHALEREKEYRVNQKHSQSTQKKKRKKKPWS
jgi:hypothetical protein